MKNLLRLYRKTTPSKRGFTLIEILVVTIIFLIIATSLSVVFKAGLDSWRRTQGRLDTYQKARMALDIMTRDISAAYLTYGSATDPTITFRGFDTVSRSGLLAPDSKEDELLFIAALNPSLNNPDVIIDLCKVGYWLREDNTLQRIYVVQTTSPLNFAFDAGDIANSSKVASNVTQLNFRYWDSATSSFSDTWDSGTGGAQAGRLPNMVEVTISIQDAVSNIAQDFSTNIYIAGSQR